MTKSRQNFHCIAGFKIGIQLHECFDHIVNLPPWNMIRLHLNYIGRLNVLMYLTDKMKFNSGWVERKKVCHAKGRKRSVIFLRSKSENVTFMLYYWQKKNLRTYNTSQFGLKRINSLWLSDKSTKVSWTQA